MALTVTLMGVDITDKVDFKTLSITDTQEVSGDNMTITMYGFDYNVFPKVGNEIIVQDDSTKEFGGILTDVEREIGEGNRLVVYNCTAIDYTFMLDRRYLNKVYPSKAVANGNSDSVVEDILYDLKTSAEGDDATGVGDSFYNTFYSTLSSTNVVLGGATVRQQVFNRILPSQALSTLAESTGHIWWIDFDKEFHFQPFANNYASHLPVVSNSNTLYVEDNVTDFYDLNIEDTMQGLGTKAIIKDAIVKSTATTFDVYTVTAADASNGVSVKLGRRPFSELDIVSVVRTRGGSDTTFTQALEDIDRDRSNTDAPTPSTTAFIYVGRQGQNDAEVRFTSHELNTNDILKITYNYSTNDDHENIDTSAVAKAASATGGDGYHEFVFSQGSEISVTGLAEMDEVAQILLDRKSKILRRGSFISLTKGWQAGQIFTLNWDHEFIQEEMWVINVSKRVLTPADDPNIEDNVIESRVQFANIPRGLRL